MLPEDDRDARRVFWDTAFARPRMTYEDRVRAALRSADIVGTWDGDLVAGLVYGDANFARIYDVDPEIAARGLPRGGYMKNIHPDDLPGVRAAIDRMFAGAPDYSNEHRILRADGAERWVLTRGRLVRDGQGNPMRFAGVSVDITERRRAEARQAFLLQLSDRLRALADPSDIVEAAVGALGRHLRASRVGYGQVQPDDRTIFIETSYADGVGALAGMFPLDAFGAHNVALHQAGRTITLDDARADPLNAEAFAASEIRAVASVPLIRHGKFTASLFVSHRDPHPWDPADVSLIEAVAERIWDTIERARAEAALRDLNLSLEQEVDHRTRERDRTWRLAPVLMVVSDDAGRVLEVNPAWTRILGWRAEATVGRDLTEFVAPEDRDAFASRTGPLAEHPITLLTESAERRRIAWTTVSEGGRLFAYGRDVTELVQVEERLRQAQKMEAVGQLTGGIAHDFNNLITGITGNLELLQNRLQQGRVQDLERYVTAAQGASRRAAALTERLLAFSRRQTLDPQPVDINELVIGMTELVRSALGPAHALRILAEDALWTTLVDPPQLESALLNLCINARDAMPAPGVLTIQTTNERYHTKTAQALGVAEGDYVSLTVSDTGTGMAPETVQRAFDPFFTTKPLGSGSGLGLSMIYGFARQSNGQVRIQSVVGQGTSVSIYLPRHIGS